MLFGNPVRGVIHPIVWRPPLPDNHEFRVSQRFGCTGFDEEPALGDCDHFHRAIDLGNRTAGGPNGPDILAANPGRVRLAEVVTGGSLAVIIGHGDGWFSIYGHLHAKQVKVGDEVVRGTVLGKMGSTGASAAHLHFGVKSGATFAANVFRDDNGTWENPWRLMEINVRIHPITTVDGVRIRNVASVEGDPFAVTTPEGRIRRFADGLDLGKTSGPRKWGGTAEGGEYEVDGVIGRTWERIRLDGDFRFIAQPLSVRSAS